MLLFFFSLPGVPCAAVVGKLHFDEVIAHVITEFSWMIGWSNENWGYLRLLWVAMSVCICLKHGDFMPGIAWRCQVKPINQVGTMLSPFITT